MLNKTKTLRSFTLATVLGTVLGMASMAPAFAVESQDECKSVIGEMTRNLLKADVSSDTLTQIDSTLIKAWELCTSGDFATATTLISDADAQLSDISQN